MIKILNIIGARPQIIKAAAITRAIKNKFSDSIKEIIVHTGQHYDHNMSGQFMEELGIPKPDINLNIGSGNHGYQTAEMIKGIEDVLLNEKPEWVLVYGDTNSTLAAAIAASKLHYPIAHIEAGLRSFNKTMPEEINRILCDHCSTLLFTPTKTGLNNLINEGFKPKKQNTHTIDNPGIYHCGDVMYDNSLFFSKQVGKTTKVLEQNNIKANNFILATIHRPSNTDKKEDLLNIFTSLNEIAIKEGKQIVLPLHPRTKNKLNKFDLIDYCYKLEGIMLINPASFLDMIMLEKNAEFIITDSGGVQKEAFFFNKKCLVLRKETEWVEIIENNAGVLSSNSKKKILEGYKHLKKLLPNFDNLYGDGNAAEFICEKIVRN